MTAEVSEFSDTAAEMVEVIIAEAFPALNRVVETGGETLPEDKVRAVLRDELGALVQASWRHEQTKRRDDPESRIAAGMGTSPKLIAHWRKKGEEAEQRARNEPPPNEAYESGRQAEAEVTMPKRAQDPHRGRS